MKAPYPILVGIDFSPASTIALRQALKIAGKTGNPVIAIHVMDLERFSLWARGRKGNLDPSLAVDAARQRLEELVKAEPAADTVRIEIRSGRPGSQLIDAVTDYQAASLVLAANDFTKKRLGTVASQCVRSAACDVLVVRDWQGGQVRKIVACVDLSPASQPVLERAAALAGAHDADLEIVHVIYPPDRDVWGEILAAPDEPASYASTCRQQARTDLERHLAPMAPALEGVRCQLTILESTLASISLTHHIRDSSADLTILGTRGQSRLSGYFLGTNAERLLHDASCSVLAVRT